MGLLIEYNDKSGLNIYALLFNDIDKSKAFNLEKNKFEDFESQDVSNIILDEAKERIGYYSFEIIDVSNIPATTENNGYSLEIYRKVGETANRTKDTFMGASIFYWDGKKEVSLCSEVCNDLYEVKKSLDEQLKEIKKSIDAIKPINKTLPSVQTPRIGTTGTVIGSAGFTVG